MEQARRVGSVDTPWVIWEDAAENVWVVSGREKALGAAQGGFGDIERASVHVGEVRSTSGVGREGEVGCCCSR